MVSLPEPNSDTVLIQPAAAPGTVTEFKLVRGICKHSASPQHPSLERLSGYTHLRPCDALRPQVLEIESLGCTS